MGGLGASLRNSNREIGQVFGRILGQKDHLRLACERLNVGGIGEAPGAHIAPDHFGEILFKKRHIALCHFDHAGTIGMAAGYWSSKVGQTG